MSEPKDAAYLRLRRLQQHNSSDIPALIAGRAATAFTLQSDAAPLAPARDVNVLVYPQDPFVSTPEVRVMNGNDIQLGLANTRVRMEDSRGELAKPDAEGNYLHWPGSPEFDQV